MGTAVPLEFVAGTELTATVGKVYGSYITLFIESKGTIYECPVLLGALYVHDEYKEAWDEYVTEVMHPGTEVSVVITGGVFRTQSGSMPVVDVMTSLHRPLSMDALERGWAVPMESALLTMSDRRAYIDSVSRARVGNSGLWGDEYLRSDLSKVVSQQLLIETKPNGQGFWEAWKGPTFCVGVVILLYLAWQHWMRYYDPVTIAHREEMKQKDAERNFMSRWAFRLGRWGVGFAVINPFRMSLFSWAERVIPPKKRDGSDNKQG